MTLNLVFIIVAFTNVADFVFNLARSISRNVSIFCVASKINGFVVVWIKILYVCLFYSFFFSFFLLYVMKKDMYISLNFNIFKHQIVLSDIALDTYFKSHELSM